MNLKHEGDARGLRPVVYLPTWAHWNEMKQRPQYLLETFASRGHEVYFVDFDAPEMVVDGVRIVPSLDRVPTEGVILYIHYAPIAHLLDSFTDPIVVYDILDDLTLFEADEVDVDPDRSFRRNHALLMDRADVVIASNSTLIERHRHERSDLVLVENGVDIDRFSADSLRPQDLPEGGPIIGYNGMISTWFAFELVAGLARRRPEWRFVLVGPVDDRARRELDDLLLIGSVIWLGERPSDQMPSYAAAYDVGAVWFEVNHMTEAVTPLKLFEYLAAGTPAVSTPLPACVGVAGVSVASSPDEFDIEIQRLLEVEGWRGDVDEFSWEARSTRLHERLDQLIS